MIQDVRDELISISKDKVYGQELKNTFKMIPLLSRSKEKKVNVASLSLSTDV